MLYVFLQCVVLVFVTQVSRLQSADLIQCDSSNMDVQWFCKQIWWLWLVCVLETAIYEFVVLNSSFICQFLKKWSCISAGIISQQVFLLDTSKNSNVLSLETLLSFPAFS